MGGFWNVRIIANVGDDEGAYGKTQEVIWNAVIIT